MADLEPSRGAVIAKTRPVLVLSPDDVGRLPLRIVVPVTDWKDRYELYPWMTRIDPESDNGLFKPSAADAFQVRSISVLRFTRRLGAVDTDTADLIASAVAVAVGLPSTE